MLYALSKIGEENSLACKRVGGDKNHQQIYGAEIS